MLENKTHEYHDVFLGIHTIQDMFTRDTLLFNSFLDKLPFCLWIHDEYYSIIHSNRAFKEIFGACQTEKCYRRLMGRKSPCTCCLSKKTLGTRQSEYCKSCKRCNLGYDANIFHIPIINEAGEKFMVKSSLHFDDLSKEQYMVNGKGKNGTGGFTN